MSWISNNAFLHSHGPCIILDLYYVCLPLPHTIYDLRRSLASSPACVAHTCMQHSTSTIALAFQYRDVLSRRVCQRRCTLYLSPANPCRVACDRKGSCQPALIGEDSTTPQAKRKQYAPKRTPQSYLLIASRLLQFKKNLQSAKRTVDLQFGD